MLASLLHCIQTRLSNFVQSCFWEEEILCFEGGTRRVCSGPAPNIGSRFMKPPFRRKFDAIDHVQAKMLKSPRHKCPSHEMRS